MSKGILIESLSWKDAEPHFTTDAVVVIPLGAASKEHGYHLQLQNDRTLVEYLKEEVLNNSNVLVLPTVTYFYYPAFVDYPGSISLSADTSTNIIVEICQSISKFGPRRFYVLNTGVSTITALEKSADSLKAEGIILLYTNLELAQSPACEEISTQEGGSHADEVETSMMLYIAPETVNMKLATNFYSTEGEGPLRRQKTPGSCFSESGVWGDATLATREKGEKVVKCLVRNILQDIESLRQIPLS
jgi:creatinine amidohydrolase